MYCPSASVRAARPLPAKVTIAPATALPALVTLPPMRKTCCMVGGMSSSWSVTRSPMRSTEVVVSGAATGVNTSMATVAVTVSEVRNLLPIAVQNSDGFFSSSGRVAIIGSGGVWPLNWPFKNEAGILG
jgi:hypothetical protein